MGFEHDSEEIKVISMGKEGSAIERVAIRKIYPPDPTAAIFWLKNRQSAKWRDKHENKVDQSSTITIMYDGGINNLIQPANSPGETP
jgi:hypothetical protein